MLQSGRVECPACGRKGVGYAPHPHAFGYKDYTKARCRYCHKTFEVGDDDQVTEKRGSK